MPPPMLNFAAIAYQKHRHNLRNAFALIDTRSPIVSVNRTMKLARLKEDANTYLHRTKENVNLLMRLNKLSRTQGEVETFHRHHLRAHTEHHRNAETHMRHVDHENEKLGRRLMRAVPLCDTRTDVNPKSLLRQRRRTQQLEKKRMKSQHFEFTMPVEILRKYENSNLKLPRSIDMQRRLLRPRIYLDLAARNSHALGRITIQLYTEASPQVVLEFVRACSQTPSPTPQRFSRRHNRKKPHPLLNFIRNYQSLWIEGELKLKLNSLCERRMEYDMRALDHNSGPGILSYASRFLRGFKNGFINFAISFRPLSVANGQRVAFGCVCGGFKTLDYLQAFGTKNGNPRNDIIVASCGVLPQ